VPETPGTTATVDRARLVADLQALVRIPSVTGSEEAVAAWVGDALREVGLATDIVRPDPAEIRADPAWPGAEMPRTSLPVVVGRAGTPGGARLILSGHLDVVPPGEPTTWTVDPWGGEIRGERLYGRGAVDMKGGVAAILGAVRALGSSPGLDALTGELLVVLVPSEEDGGQGTLAAIRELETADMAIITEPSQLDLVVAHAGAITFRLTVPGRAAHASHRREGVSALDKLFVLVRALEADEARRNESETDPLMRALLREHPATVEITGGQFGSARVPVDHGLVTSLTDAARAVTGRVPRLLGEPYGADMQMFVNVGGIPCVIFGPGDVRVAHSADEWVPLDEVEACAAVLATWVSRQIGPR
jgi:acetylornithine deacetylase